MNVSMELLALPLAETVLMGVLSGLVGALAVISRRVFFAESITHATFPGAVTGVVAATAVGTALTGARVGYEMLSIAVLLGALLMCAPMTWLMRRLSDLPGISSQAAAGIVLAVGFALGYLLSTWFAPLPLKVDGFLTGSVLNVNRADVALTVAVLTVTVIIVVVAGRHLELYCFDSVAYRAAGLNPRLPEWTVLVLICLNICVLIPAVGTILPIALIAAPAATVRSRARSTSGLLIGSAALGAICCLAGLWLAVGFEWSVGGTIAVACGLVYAASELGSYVRSPGRRVGPS
ncbi:metal ABC transporter permease [Actinomyces procaprae]|uniref:metal ABC transporter permease n=1 Tax=Actinomyces procaprae TaxID=2560010 RepID=UPI00109D833F|nr:metal ABC transporter permease [Actinomyces procaprae]